MADGVAHKSRKVDEHPLPRMLCRIVALYFIYVALIGAAAIGALIQQAAHLSDIERRVYNRGVAMRLLSPEAVDNLHQQQTQRFMITGGAMLLLWLGPAAVFVGAGPMMRRYPLAARAEEGDGDPLYAPLAVGLRVFAVAAVLTGASRTLYWIMLEGAFKPTTWVASRAMRPYLDGVNHGLVGGLLLTAMGLLVFVLARRFAAYLTQPAV